MNSIEQNFISEYKTAYEKKMARAIKKLEKTIAKIDEIFCAISGIYTAYAVHMAKSKFPNRIDVNFKDHSFDGELFTVSFWGRNFANANVALAAKNYDDGQERFDYCSSTSLDQDSVMEGINRMFEAMIDKNTKECDAVLDKMNGRA